MDLNFQISSHQDSRFYKGDDKTWWQWSMRHNMLGISTPPKEIMELYKEVRELKRQIISKDQEIHHLRQEIKGKV